MLQQLQPLTETYTGWQWMLIDAATQFGLDKLSFGDRLAWGQAHLATLEHQLPDAEEPALYHKACLAIRAAQKGISIGHMIGLDASSSGIQIMSVLTGCQSGAKATGLVDPHRRADAYSDVTALMNQVMGAGHVTVSRADAKKALMTAFYGSKEQPKAIFGTDTPELAAFYQAAEQLAPGAWDLLEILRNSWRPFALEHSWRLPDGYQAVVRVKVKKSERIEVDGLGSFTYEYNEYAGKAKGLSNIANVVHSVDAYILRSMHRRCNYDPAVVNRALKLIKDELSLGLARQPMRCTGKAGYYLEQYERSTVSDVVILPHLDETNVTQLDTHHLQLLQQQCEGMLQHPPFPLVTVHDEFKCHPNHVNQMRWQYREILAELADSLLLDDLLTQVYQEPIQYQKLSFNLDDLIRQSNYALC